MQPVIPDRFKPREAEAACLGSCLRDNGVIPEVLQIVGPEDFWFPDFQVAAEAVLDLFRAHKPVDLVTVGGWVFDRRKEQDCPPAVLAQLWDAAPTAANAAYYAQICAEASLRRSLVLTLGDLSRRVSDESGTPQALLEECESQVFALSRRKHQRASAHVRVALAEHASQLEDLQAGRKAPGLPYGYHALDELTAGMHAGELIIVGARPSTGKTALATMLLASVAERGEGVFFASLEQSRIELAERLIAQQGRINSQHLRTGTMAPDEIDRYLEVREQLARWKVFLDDSPYQSVLRIATNARRHALRDGLGLVLVDYLQLVQPEDARVSREEQVAGVSRRLKGLARELRVPVVALAQLNRQSENRVDRRPRLNDLRESGGVEQDADVVLLLHRTDAFSRGGQVIDLLLEKQRNGPRGEVSLVYRRECLRFEAMELDVPFAAPE